MKMHMTRKAGFAALLIGGPEIVGFSFCERLRETGWNSIIELGVATGLYAARAVLRRARCSGLGVRFERSDLMSSGFLAVHLA